MCVRRYHAINNDVAVIGMDVHEGVGDRRFTAPAEGVGTAGDVAVHIDVGDVEARSRHELEIGAGMSAATAGAVLVCRGQNRDIAVYEDAALGIDAGEGVGTGFAAAHILGQRVDSDIAVDVDEPETEFGIHVEGGAGERAALAAVLSWFAIALTSTLPLTVTSPPSRISRWLSPVDSAVLSARASAAAP